MIFINEFISNVAKRLETGIQDCHKIKKFPIEEIKVSVINDRQTILINSKLRTDKDICELFSITISDIDIYKRMYIGRMEMESRIKSIRYVTYSSIDAELISDVIESIFPIDFYEKEIAYRIIKE